MEDRRLYAIALSEELSQFERPLPVMDDYDLLLTRGGGSMKNPADLWKRSNTP